jgi:hypothetical protein
VDKRSLGETVIFHVDNVHLHWFFRCISDSLGGCKNAQRSRLLAVKADCLARRMSWDYPSDWPPTSNAFMYCTGLLRKVQNEASSVLCHDIADGLRDTDHILTKLLMS